MRIFAQVPRIKITGSPEHAWNTFWNASGTPLEHFLDASGTPLENAQYRHPSTANAVMTNMATNMAGSHDWLTQLTNIADMTH